MHATLTIKEMSYECGGHDDDVHEEVRHGQVSDEHVGDGAHAWRPYDHRHHEAVPHHAHERHQDVGDAVEDGDGEGVTV